jgi:uncharacterized protein with PhoU and TrkA domain
MDQMLRSDAGLRVEEVIVPASFSAAPLSVLAPKSQEYLLMATHEQGKWIFNPPEDHIVMAGAVLVIMASPDGRVHLEKRLKA